MKIKTLLIAIFFAFPFIFSANVSLGANYDIYVDKDYSADDADGSSEKPYETIAKALEKSSSGDKIYIKNGTYTENIPLKKEVALYGQKRDGVVIQGTIEASGDNKLKNLTISGKSYGIVASGKISIDNCKIKNSSKIGINLLESGQEASITNSTITGNQKGIYVQRKRSIFITENSIYKNREEGLDMREKVSGDINKNDISENGEGGIEVIVGGADLKISHNTIKKNKANGIVVQFYSFIEKTGSIDIQNNILSKNGKHGFGCGIPSGGKPSDSYWSNSINLENNTIENNKLKAIDSFCQIIKAVPKEEAEKNVTVEEVDIAEEIENNEIKEQALKERLIEQMEINNSLFAQSEELKKIISKQNKLSRFFRGIKKEELFPIEEKQKKIREQLEFFNEIQSETELEENKITIQDAREKLNSKAKELDDFIKQQKDKFSLFGWFFKF